MILATVYLVFPADVSFGQMLILFSYFVSFLWVILKIENKLYSFWIPSQQESSWFVNF